MKIYEVRTAGVKVYICFHKKYFQVCTSLNAKVIKVEMHPISQFFGNFATFHYVNYDVINLLRHGFICGLFKSYL